MEWFTIVVSVGSLSSRFVFNMLDKISDADTLSPCHQNVRSVFRSSMSLQYMLTDDDEQHLTLNLTIPQIKLTSCFLLGFFFFANVQMILEDFSFCSFTTEESVTQRGLIVSFTVIGHDRQHSVLTAKIKNDRWTEICWAAHCPATTQARAQRTKENCQTLGICTENTC